MTGNYWIKLYIEIIDDPKMATLPDRLWRRVIELFLLAGKFGKEGYLPTTMQLAWLMRMETDELEMDLQQLANTGIVESIPNGWYIPKFKERQAPIPGNIRAQETRKKIKAQQYYQDDDTCNEDVTNRYNDVTQINRLTESESYTDTEQNHKDDDDNVFKVYTDNIAPLTKATSEKLLSDEQEYGGKAVIDAINKACSYNHRNLAYIEGILRNKGGKKQLDKEYARTTPAGRARYGDVP